MTGTGTNINVNELTDEQKDVICAHSNAYKVLESKYQFMQRQFNALLSILEHDVGRERSNTIIQQLGCECAKGVSFIPKYIGDLDGYMGELKRIWGEDVTYDEPNKKIIVTTPERECVCPMGRKGLTSDQFCNCSLGWQKTAFETVLQKKVTVAVKESSLRGSTRCVFEVDIID